MTQIPIRLELLAPARTAASGIIAVNFGADAVYIGAPAFGARAAAGNTVPDIGKLVQYAHQYHARVFVALNTILFDNELEEARRLIWQLHETGVDAIIVQDKGILMMDLPPVELHASTQAHNYHPERIQFLDQVGFSRIVLARELTLLQIRAIREVTAAELEFFVHGALCVSFSGQCYMSASQGGRSGNRGVCAQPCRKIYDLIDANGNIIEKQKHLLSLKDLDLSGHLADLASAGITSFKIEGRLKDDNYLKNITAFYRKRLDAFLEGSPDFRKASSGRVYFDFDPNPSKTFSRGTGSYFLNGRNPEMVNFDTPKSSGEYVGKVIRSKGKILEAELDTNLNNNDGITYFDGNGRLAGVKINTAKGNTITLASVVNLRAGTPLFRNYDHVYNEMLKQSRTIRKIGLSIRVAINGNTLTLHGEDEDGNRYGSSFGIEWQPAQKPENAREMFVAQLSKPGETPFEVTGITFEWEMPVFLPVSELNRLRRRFLIGFMDHRLANRPKNKIFQRNPAPVYPVTAVSFSENISNHLAAEFYRAHGVVQIEQAAEVTGNYKGKKLMTMKHCLKYQLGYCPREAAHKHSGWIEPIYLVDGNLKFRLGFDCKTCQMELYQQ